MQMAWFKREKRDYEREFLDSVFIHWEALMRYATRLTGNEAQAEDVVQESLAKAFKAFPKLREKTNHRAWAFTIVRNTFLSRARKQNREQPLEDAARVVDLSAGPELRLVRPDDGYKHGFEDAVLEALTALPEAQRTAVMLCDVEGLSYDEIAQVLGCPVGTVRSRIHHARRRLRETLASYATNRGYGNVGHLR